MKKSILYLLCAVAIVFILMLAGDKARVAAQDTVGKEPSRLAVLWTSGDPEVAHRVCFLYTHTAKKAKWFDEVTLIVWGPSQKLLVADKDIQAEVKAMQQDGVTVQACIVCANSYGIADQIRALGIEVKGMGAPLTEILKGDWKVITF